MHILFVIGTLERSSASIALMERLYLLAAKTHRADLFVLHAAGPYRNKLPAHIRLLHSLPAATIYDEIAVFAPLSDAETVSFCKNKNIKSKNNILYLFFDDKSSYDHPFSLIKFAFNKSKIMHYPGTSDSYLACFHQIFTQKYPVKAAFLRLHPSLAERTFTLPNNIEQGRTLRLAGRPAAYPDPGFGGIRILHAATPSLDANQLLSLQAAWILKKRGFYFRMYLLCQSRYIELLIRIMKLNDVVFLLKGTPNPYPFIRTCDVFLCTEHPLERRSVKDMLRDCLSKSQAALCPPNDNPLLEAALLLEKPIVAINTPLLHRRLEWEEDSLLIEDDPQVLADAIEYMCEDL